MRAGEARRHGRCRLILAATLAAAAPAALGLYATAVEPAMLVVRRLRVPLAGWDRPDLRVGVLADVHAALPMMGPRRVRAIAERLAAERPDLVLLPGDYVSTHTRFVRPVPVEPVAEALRPLAAAAPAVSVLGNHDHRYGARRVAAALEAAGIAVLANGATRVGGLPGGPLAVAGLDDMFTRRHDLGRTLAAVGGRQALMLSHVPDVFPLLPPEAAIPLVVAGHTHGGQMVVPGYGPLVTLSRLPRAMTYGLAGRGGRRLYVSGGVGTTRWPVRFCRPPEIAVLTLTGED